jgi:hypothetical protein
MQNYLIPVNRFRQFPLVRINEHGDARYRLGKEFQVNQFWVPSNRRHAKR